MQQVELYLKGERDYTNLKGDTGPLVYPGLHVYIYRALYSLTDGGKNILVGQVIFAGLYLATLAVVMSCYRKIKVPLSQSKVRLLKIQAPPYIYPLLILSKRLHSIFILRLFNDGFTVFFLFCALNMYQSRSWNLGTFALSCALGVKMNILLVVPALAFIFLQSLGVDRSITQVLIVLQSQGLFAYEFVRVDWRAYVSRAFELSRAFLYKWTVNWRFIPESIFQSSVFSYGLLSLHASLLLLFAYTRWSEPSGRSFPAMLSLYFTSRPSEDVTDEIAESVTAEFVTTAMLTANAIGMLCARSLHYQFYSWLAWTTPYLLWRAGLEPVLIWAVWGMQEWAWNMYPSTETSSRVVVACLALQVGGVWWATRPKVEAKGEAKKKE
jgi:alpha-1,3-mannosyltransferase